MIKVGHRTFSDQLRNLTNQLCACADMSGKRLADGSVEGVPRQRQQKRYEVFLFILYKSVAKNEKELAKSNIAFVQAARPR